MIGEMLSLIRDEHLPGVGNFIDFLLNCHGRPALLLAKDGIFIDANDVFFDLFGLTVYDLKHCDMTAFDLICKNNHKKLYRHILLNDGKPYKLTTLNGTKIFAAGYGITVNNASYHLIACIGENEFIETIKIKIQN
jgi:hypothetical protein